MFEVDMNNIPNRNYCGYIGESTLNSPSSGKYGRYININGQQIATMYISYNTSETYIRGKNMGNNEVWSSWKAI